MQEVPDNPDFSATEEIIAAWWNSLDVPSIKRMKQAKNNSLYACAERPYFTTEFPHYEYILKNILKDVFTRYAHQTSLHSEETYVVFFLCRVFFAIHQVYIF